ncbi:MAG: response regulator [candidate division NC10 bacterium]|nr:response regulator [candidate division NC10 bacterium]
MTDTGIGIKSEDLPRLFQEFAQLETTRAQKHEGTGLGLALTKRLVELHGGRILAESAGEGRGSTFTFVLPFIGPGAPAEALAGAPSPPRGGDPWPPLSAGRPARILIADDDPHMRELVSGLVGDLGYDAVAVPDGKAALAAVAVQPPDLLLSDVTMPGLDGFEVCRRLKADPATRLIPVVLITGIGDEHKIQGIEAGADDLLGKPFSPGELRARIRALLRMKVFLDELEHAEAVLCTLGRSIEGRDPYTQGHCERLTDYAVALGQLLGLPEEDLSALQRGAYLHDLGKVAVPDAILLKTGSLTPEERGVMQRHAVIGEEICRPLRSLQAVWPIIRHHHERQDGSGYPDGLRGETIPLTARIIQVVDVFDALTTDRPYRRALPRVTALETLEAEVGQGWWDPQIVRAFRAVANDMGSG